MPWKNLLLNETQGIQNTAPYVSKLLLRFSPCIAPHPAPPALSQQFHVRSQPHWYSLPFPSCSAVNLQTGQETATFCTWTNTCILRGTCFSVWIPTASKHTNLLPDPPALALCHCTHRPIWLDYSHSGAWSLCSLFAKGTSSLLHLMPSHSHRVPRMRVKTTPSSSLWYCMF